METQTLTYASHYINLDAPDEITWGEMPEEVLNAVKGVVAVPTSINNRRVLVEACERAGLHSEAERQKFDVNTLTILHILTFPPKVQAELLAAEVGFVAELCTITDMLWQWTTSRSNNSQKDDSKKIKKYKNRTVEYIAKLVKEIEGHYHSTYDHNRRNLLSAKAMLLGMQDLLDTLYC